MSDQITLTVDGIEVSVPKGSTVKQACEVAAKEIPHFCYHKRLSIAGNCRMCMVEVEGAPKPVASCHWPANNGMVVKTDSPIAHGARKDTMELMLINHPLDCPECDQGGECTLQDLCVAYGGDKSHFHEAKLTKPDPEIGAKIKTVMNRCITCMRCVRFATEIAGVSELGATGRGEHTEVGPYVEQAMLSELAGNMIDLCPVGALTNKPFAFKARSWELTKTPTIDVMDAMGSNINLHHVNGEILRITPRENDAVNEEWIADNARYACDGLTVNRLDTPLIKTSSRHSRTGWNEAMKAITKQLAKSKGEKIATLAGGALSAHDLYAINSLTHALGSDNIDAREYPLNTTNRALYTLNTPLADIEEANAILLFGCNPRFEAPILNIRLRTAVKNGAQVGVIGAVEDLTYATTAVGATAADLANLGNAKTGFAQVLKNAETSVIIAGAAALANPENLIIAQQAAAKLGATLNILHNTASGVAAMDMQTYPQTTKGKNRSQIINALKRGSLDTLIIMGEVDGLTADLLKDTFTIYIGTHENEISKAANIVLPQSAYSETNAWFTNAEGRVQQANRAVLPPLHAKDGWLICSAIATAAAAQLPFNNKAEMEAAMVKQNRAYGKVGKFTVSKMPITPTTKITPSVEPLVGYSKQFYQSNDIMRASIACATLQAEICAAAKLKQKQKKIA